MSLEAGRYKTLFAHTAAGVSLVVLEGWRGTLDTHNSHGKLALGVEEGDVTFSCSRPVFETHYWGLTSVNGTLTIRLYGPAGQEFDQYLRGEATLYLPDGIEVKRRY